MEHKWNRHWGPELLLKTNTCTISPGYFCIISQDSESRKEASLTKLSIPVKNQYILNQLDVLFVLEVSIPCTTACIFFTEISTSSSFSSIKSPRGGSQALAIGFKLVLCCPSDGALLLKFRFLVFKRWTRTAFLKSCGWATPVIFTSSLGGFLTPTFSILIEYTPKKDWR